MAGLPRKVHVHRRASALSAIHGPSEFWEVIERERGRTDRRGRGFALVVFDVGPSQRVGAQARVLRSRLVEEVRIVDTIGWLDERRLGVLLVSASADGGGRFVSRIAKRNGREGRELECSVHAYPGSWGLGMGGITGLEADSVRQETAG